MKVVRLLKNKFVGFILLGSINTAFSFFVYYVLIKLHLFYVIANLIAYIVGIILGYTLNNLILFKNEIKHFSFFRYILVYILSYSINFMLITALVEWFSFKEISAQFICVIIMTILNYFLVKLFCFIKVIN